MSTVILLQHGKKLRDPVDPDLTEQGVAEAEAAAVALQPLAPTLLVSSPRRRTQATIAPLARALGREVEIDERAAERMEWVDGVYPDVPAFLEDWGRASADVDYRPRLGDSSRGAGTRLRDLVVACAQRADTTVVATHGGVTVDLLRLLGHPVSDERITEGMPTGGRTTLRVGPHGDIVVLGVGER